MKTAVIYARARGANLEQSIQKQTKACQEYAIKNGFEVIKIYSDVAVLGQADNRPALKAVFQDCECEDFDTILVFDRSRITRKMDAWFKYYKILKNTHKTMISVADNTAFFQNSETTDFLLDILYKGATK